MMPVHLEGSRRPRPRSARTIYCDGSHDAAFRPAVDLELSHWVPNLTPARYKADTSTEICMVDATGHIGGGVRAKKHRQIGNFVFCSHAAQGH